MGEISCSFAENCASVKYTSMLFANKIRELREGRQMLQCHISAALDMDNAMYVNQVKPNFKIGESWVSFFSNI